MKLSFTSLLFAFVYMGNCLSSTIQDIEIIEVSAQKRVQKEQEVPLSMQVFKGDVMREFLWDNAIDIVEQVPSLSAESFSGKSLPRFKIRGLGTSDFNIGQLSAVGVYINETVINSPVTHGFELFDVERVEILKGPQGTLWGKNNTAGAIHFVTAKANHENSAFLKSDIGLIDDNALEYQLEGVVNGSLVDETLAGRLAVKRTYRKDWISNVGNNIKNHIREVGGGDTIAGRLSFNYTPSEDLLFNFSYTVNVQDVDAVNYPGLDNHGRLRKAELSRTTYNADNYDKNDWQNATLESNWLIEDFTLTSISGWLSAQRDEFQDEDATALDGSFDIYLSDVNQWSQELRLASQDDLPFRWLLGLYYFSENLNGTSSFAGGLDSQASASSGEIVVFETGQETRKRQSRAIFSSLQYDFAEKWNVTLGLRLTRDQERITALRTNYRLNATNRHMFYDLATALPDSLNIIEDVTKEFKYNEPSWDTSVSYKFNETTNSYIRYAQGYRAGTFSPPFFLSVTEARPEFIDAWETGIKSTWLKNTLKINVSTYYYQLEDQQEIGFLGFDDAGGFLNIFGNAASSTVKGLDFEVAVVPFENAYVNAGASVIRATYDDFPVGPEQNNGGNRFARTPEWAFNLLMKYTLDIHYGSLEFSSDWHAQSQTFANANNTALGIGDQRIIGNLSVKMTPTDSSWSMALWTRNLLNEQHFPNRTGDGLIAYGAEPRKLGLSFTIDY